MLAKSQAAKMVQSTRVVTNFGEFNDAVIAKLRELARERRCPVKIYCLMPTHLHLLISAGTISVIEWVARFKEY
jgi:REP element-mobilizing transposase RayT